VPEIVKWETDSGSKSRIFFCFAWGERVRPQVESESCFEPLLVISGSIELRLRTFLWGHLTLQCGCGLREEKMWRDLDVHWT
jgi:hypothetical protein